jgi:chromosome segregation ATPase
VPANPEQLRTTVAALEQELERAHTRLREGHEAIADLERRKAEAAGNVVVAERAITELEQRLVEGREALARLEQVQAAERRLAVLVGERDAAANELAQAVAQLLAQLDTLVAARETVAAARGDVRALAGRGAVRETPPEPEAFRASWERLIERIRDDLGGELDRDLIEAAARSPFGNAIKDLPAHLRALAQERRHALLRESKSRKDDETTISG